MSFLSYVSRINIEIGRSFIHRSFPRRVEYPYLFEWGRQSLATKQEKPSTVLAVVFPLPPSFPFPPPSFLSRPSGFSLCLRSCYRIFVSLLSWRFLEGSALFSFVRFFFQAFTPTPVCLPLAAAISFFVRFSPFVGVPTAFDSFWAELA